MYFSVQDNQREADLNKIVCFGAVWPLFLSTYTMECVDRNIKDPVYRKNRKENKRGIPVMLWEMPG